MLRKIYILVVTVFMTIFAPSLCHAEYFSVNASYQVCFTPGQDCAQLIVDEVAKAKKQVLVQMYIFTNHRIAKSILDAKKRGVDVKILLDRNQIGSKYSSVDFFKNNNIPVRIDCIEEGIAHNKILLIDGVTTVGGSFNYTNTAQKKNLENVVIVKDPIFTKKFLDNWNERYQGSIPAQKSKVLEK